ncbi:MAG: hypothetical protein QM767_04905 [Anaeromyxobacter sp.]
MPTATPPGTAAARRLVTACLVRSHALERLAEGGDWEGALSLASAHAVAEPLADVALALPPAPCRRRSASGSPS